MRKVTPAVAVASRALDGRSADALTATSDGRDDDLALRPAIFDVPFYGDVRP